MKAKSFFWMTDTAQAWNDKTLVPFQEYKMADFDENVVAEWVRTGVARMSDTDEKKSKQEKE